MQTLILAIVGVLIGGLITWVVARYYYGKASKELKLEANELKIEASDLRRLTTLMLHGMEYAGWIQIKRDSSGKILGFNQTITVSGIQSEGKVGSITVISSPAKTDT